MNGRDFAALLVTTMHGVAEQAIRFEGALPPGLTLQDVPPERWGQLEAALNQQELSGFQFIDAGPRS